MIRISNFIVVFINTLLLITGLALLGFGITFVVQGNTNCQKVLTDPLLIIGAFLSLVAFLGLIGALCKSNFVMFVYLAVLFISIIGLIGLTVFVFLITNPGAGKVFSDRGFKEHKTWDFSNWLQNHFVNGNNWVQIKSCLIDANVCGNAGNDDDYNSKSLVFFHKTVPIIQAGCCSPPTECGFRRKNATLWEAPKSGPATKDHDCEKWSNDPLELCYNCNSCKEGILVSFKKEWRTLAIINVIILVFLILVYSIGCCARRSNEKSNKKYLRGFA